MTMLGQLEATTNDYFMVDDKKANDLYFESEFLLDHFLKNKKGLMERPGGGLKIRVPIRYDGNTAGFYSKGDTISSDKKDAITAALFEWRHCYGNATILRIDTLLNAGAEQFIDLVWEELYGAQMSLTQILAESIFDDVGGSTERFTGVRAMCNETTTTAYGGITEAEVLSEDGTYVWEGMTKTTAEFLTADVVRTLRSDANYGLGKKSKPDLGATTETLYNSLVSQLAVQQRFVSNTESAPVKAGFTGIRFEEMDIFPSKGCPSGWFFGINSSHFGFAIHKKGMFVRTPWHIIEGSPEDKTMKIFVDGNTICNNRRAHKAHSGLT